MATNSTCDTVLFLGAGFSCDAGMPTMANFGQEAKRDHEGLSKHTKADNLRNSAQLLVKSAEVFEAFQKFCKQAQTFTSEDINNMEKIFCTAEILKETGISNIILDGAEYLIEEIIEKIKLWLWKIYQQCPLLNSERKTETHEETYTKFFDIIKRKEICRKLTVITTNYDLIFEYTSWKNKLQCVYPFSKNSSVTEIKAGGNGEVYA